MTSPFLQNARTLKQRVWDALHHDIGRTGHAANFLLLVTTVVSLAVLPLEFFPGVRHYQGFLGTVELLSTTIFIIDYVLRIWSAPNHLRYILSFYGVVDLLSIIPYFLGMFGWEYVRLLRLVRIFKLGDIEPASMDHRTDRMRDRIGLTNEEKLEYVVARHPIYLFLATLPPLVAMSVSFGIFMISTINVVFIVIAVLLLLFAVVFLWKAWLDFNYDVLFITNRRLIWQEQHLFGRSINQVNFHAITNVKPYFTSFLSYIIGYGDIIIETPAAEIGQIIMRTVRHHEQAAHRIMHKCAEAVHP